MVRKVYPRGKILIEKFIEAMVDYEGFTLIGKDTICQFSFDDKYYYAYIKAISPQGGPHPLEHQRAQLPYHDRFQEVIESSIPFLFLGYDIDNDVFVCWDPHKVKPRLNHKSYVSFYSRLSIQEGVKPGKIEEGALSNEDKFVLFKRADTVSFLQKLDFYFPGLKPGSVVSEMRQPAFAEALESISQGQLDCIEDDESVRQFLDSYPSGFPFLSILGECMSQFSKNYSGLQLADWVRLIRSYLDSKPN